MSDAKSASSSAKSGPQRSAPQAISQYDAYLADWQRQCLEVGEAAYQSAAKAELEGETQALRDSDTHWIATPATVSPRGRAVAQEACNEARARWEASNK